MDWADLVLRAEGVLAEFSSLQEEAGNRRTSTNNSATFIQTRFRVHVAQRRLQAYREAAMKLQKLMRGIKGKNKLVSVRLMHVEATRNSLRNLYAATVQRSFRGWYSRKYRFSNWRRKQFKAHVIKRGKEIVSEMNEYAASQREVGCY
jgi:hypothetical protein